MSNFHTKTAYEESDLTNLIATNAEESIYLEFKSGKALADNQHSKYEIEKDISAFANSDGGLLIYGIDENDNKADSLSFVDGRAFTKEWLEQVINSRIKKPIPDLLIYPVRFNNDIAQSIYVVKIPRSPVGPHMLSDGRYFKRANFKVNRMEEYEVRDHYSRVNNTVLEIEDYYYKIGGVNERDNKYSEILFDLSFQVRNIGNVIEKNYKLEVLIPELIYLHGRTPDRKNFIRNEGNFMLFSIPNSSPIFQNELTTTWTVKVNIQFNDFMILNTVGIRTTLYYSGGIKERRFYPLEKLAHNGKLIEHLPWVK
ncbi:MAG: ATP-binding protein [Bacteroidetes bacterium]|nr:ATP-binding protein [Bacteroidota bacterium]